MHHMFTFDEACEVWNKQSHMCLSRYTLSRGKLHSREDEIELGILDFWKNILQTILQKATWPKYILCWKEHFRGKLCLRV